MAYVRGAATQDFTAVPSYNMQSWSLSDLGNPASLGIGSSFTVSLSATADIVTVTDGGTDDTPDDFNPVDSDQLVSGTVDGVTYNNALHEYELGYQVTDGTNIFTLVWVNTGASQQGSNQTITSDGYFVVMEDPSNPGGGGLVPGVTYTILDEDISVNFSNNGTFDVSPVYSDFFVCFARGTGIETAAGVRPVQSLRAGDLVRTLDHGLQPIRWICGRTVSGCGKLAPIVISKNALGDHGRLAVSPQHRVLVSDWRAQLYFEQDDVLVAAKHLANGDRIFQSPCTEVEYWHFLFDQHEIVTANGVLAESFHPGQPSLDALDEEVLDELFAIFPELAYDPASYGHSARYSLTKREARLLRDRA